MESKEKDESEIISQLIGYYGKDPICTYNEKKEKEAFTILNDLYSYYKEFASEGIFSRCDIEKNILQTIAVDKNFGIAIQKIIDKYKEYGKQEYKHFFETLLNKCKCEQYIRENALWDEQSLRTLELNYTVKGLRSVVGYPFYPALRRQWWGEIQRYRKKLAPFALGLLPKENDYEKRRHELRELVHEREYSLLKQKKRLETRKLIEKTYPYTPTDYEKECLILYVRFSLMLLWIEYSLKNPSNSLIQEISQPNSPTEQEPTKTTIKRKQPLRESINNFLQDDFDKIITYLSRDIKDENGNITKKKILEPSDDTNYEYKWNATLRDFVYFVALINGQENTKIGNFLKEPNPNGNINWKIFLDSIEVRDTKGNVINDSSRCSQKYNGSTYGDFKDPSNTKQRDETCYRIYQIVMNWYKQPPTN